MTDTVSRVGVEFTSIGANSVQKSLDDVAASGTKTEASLKKASAATDTLAAEGRKAVGASDALAQATGGLANAADGAVGKLAAEAQAIKALDGAHTRAVGSSKALQGVTLNLSRQFSDIGVQLAGGQNPLLIAIQQLPQIADGFQAAKQQGLSFKDAISGITSGVSKFLPLIIAGGAAVAVFGGAFLLWQKHVKDTALAIKALAKDTQDFVDVQNSTRDALFRAVEFADKYKVAGTGVSKALDALLISQDATYAAAIQGISATDAAGRAAAQRAEQEKLLTVALLKKYAVEAQGRAKTALDDAQKNANTANFSGVIAAFGTGDVGFAADTEAQQRKKLGVETLKQTAAAETAYAKTLNDSAAALLKSNLIIPEHTKHVRAHKEAVDKDAEAAKRAAEHTAEYIKGLEAENRALGLGEVAVKRLASAREIESALKQGDTGSALRIRQLQLDKEAIEDTIKTVAEATANVKALDGTYIDFGHDFAEFQKTVSRATTHIKQDAGEVIRKFLDIRRTGDDMFDAIKHHDWASAFDGLLRTLELVKAAFKDTATAGDKVAAAGAVVDAAGHAIGGKAGRALSAGANAGVTTFAATGNPVLAAIAVTLAQLSVLLKSKPSNAGAGIALNETSLGGLSGKSRTDDTTKAATAVGTAILAGEQALRDAGATLTKTITGLVIGTRDQTQIYTSAGETLRTAVGDATEATEAALRAVLQGATFVNEAEKKLVDSLLAAGKSFDDITTALQNYAQAQTIAGNLADQILQLTDPKAFDLKAVRDAVADQRKAAQEAATAGYLTAAQLAGINAQLSTLEGLKLDEVLKRYGQAVNDNVAQRVGNAQSGVADAQQTLLDAYAREADALTAHANSLRSAADGLRKFSDSLNPARSGALGSRAALAVTRAAFLRTSAAAQGGDEKAIGQLQGVSEAFLAASKAAAPDARAFARDQAAVRNAVENTARAADAQASLIEQQLQSLHDQVALLVQLDAHVVSVQEAIGALSSAVFELASAQAAATQTQDERAGGIVVPAPAQTGAAAPETSDRMAAAMEEQNRLLAEQNALLKDIAKTSTTQANVLQRVTRDGDSLLTAAA